MHSKICKGVIFKKSIDPNRQRWCQGCWNLFSCRQALWVHSKVCEFRDNERVMCPPMVSPADIRLNKLLELRPVVEKIILHYKPTCYGGNLSLVQNALRTRPDFAQCICFSGEKSQEKELHKKLTVLLGRLENPKKWALQDREEGAELMNDIQGMSDGNRYTWFDFIDEDDLYSDSMKQLEQMKPMRRKKQLYARHCLFIKRNMLKKYMSHAYINVIGEFI